MVAAVGLDDNAVVQAVDRAVEVDHALDQGHVDVLTLAGAALVVQRGHDGGVGVRACEVVSDGDAVLDGVAALFAVDADHAGDGLTEKVEAGTGSVWAGLTEGADGAVNELGVYLLHGLIAETETIHDAGAEALNKNVSVLDELLAYLNRARILEVHDDGLLASVDPGMGHALAFDEGGVGSCGVAGL